MRQDRHGRVGEAAARTSTAEATHSVVALVFKSVSPGRCRFIGNIRGSYCRSRCDYSRSGGDYCRSGGDKGSDRRDPICSAWCIHGAVFAPGEKQDNDFPRCRRKPSRTRRAFFGRYAPVYARGSSASAAALAASRLAKNSGRMRRLRVFAAQTACTSD